MKSRIVAFAASCALAVGGMLVAPVIGDAPVASANAFTCVQSWLVSGGWSKADGCRGSQYYEKVRGYSGYRYAPWAKRGYYSTRNVCEVGWMWSSYIQTV